MVLEALGGAALLAFGVALVYFSFENDVKDSTFLAYLFIGIACIIGGGWIILTRVTLVILLTKLAGLILAAIGLFIVFHFPDVSEYQPEAMGKAGVLVGLFLLIFGAYLLFFA